MGLRATVQQAVVTAFQALGDIPRPVTYKALTGAVVRDLDAGTTVAASVNYPLALTVFTKFIEKEVDDKVVVQTDEKLLFPALHLPVTPKTADIVVDEYNRIWEVVRRLGDPASGLVTLHMRTSR